MKSPTNARSLVHLDGNTVQRFICIALFALTSGCASFSNTEEDKSEVSLKTHPLSGNPNEHKSIFVFLDGTRNDPKSGTNVRRLYDLISKNNDPQTTTIYIEGVGSVDMPLFGAALGRGMEKRILRGYEFIAQNYKSGDDIYIFGFSRGAHEARSLAGFLAYAGVPKLSDENRDHLMTIGNRILELTKDKIDEDYLDKWITWNPGQAPLLAAEIKDKRKQEMQTVEVKFLGVWDTVPGSSFKKYENCKEEIGFWKTWFYWVPGIDKGNRYKTDSYPAIREIAHAVSIDEKRSKFAPILLCRAINSTYTKLNEMWFPGAHSDVGGGYDDSSRGYDNSKGLPSISLNWMLGLLNKSYKFNTAVPRLEESAKGLAHWSYGDAPVRHIKVYGECEDRRPPQDSIHESFYDRKGSSPVPIRIGKTVESLEYPNPKVCPD